MKSDFIVFVSSGFYWSKGTFVAVLGHKGFRVKQYDLKAETAEEMMKLVDVELYQDFSDKDFCKKHGIKPTRRATRYSRKDVV